MNRREFLAASAAAVVLPATARHAIAADAFGGSIDWKQASGQTINVFMAGHPWQEAIEPEIASFQALTGITVQLRKLPEADYKTKLAADLSAGAFEYDVFMNEYYDAQKYQQERWTAPLDAMLTDAKLTDAAWYDQADFFPGARQIATIGGKYTDRVAITSEAQVLIYRTDVVPTPPATFDDLLATATRISAGGKLRGITLRGGAALWWPLYGVVRSYGGDYLTSALKPVVDSAADKAAVEMYAELARQAPEGVTSYDWDEINTAMLSGQAAMFLDSSVVFSRVKDPALSSVADKVAAAPFPAGPGGRHGASHFWSISIAEGSKAKTPAWLFVQWATSKPIQARLQSKGVLAPRNSAYTAAGPSGATGEAGYLAAVRTSLQSAVILPANAKFFELMDPLRAGVQGVVLGDQKAGPMLDDVQAQWIKILGA